MSVDIVVSPRKANEQILAAQNIIGSFSFLPGERYAEYRRGDKIASYGLTALIAGGVGAAVVKSGVLAGVVKALGKLLVFVGVAIAAFFRRMIAAVRGIFRSKATTEI